MIKIQPTEAELLRKYKHVHRLAYHIHYRHTINRIAILFLLTILLTAAVWTLTDADTWVTFKGVSFLMTPLILVICVAYFSWLAYQRNKTWQWCKSAAKDFIKNRETAIVSFDEHQLIVQGENYRTDVQWDYFKYFHEDDRTIYLFTAQDSLYHC